MGAGVMGADAMGAAANVALSNDTLAHEIDAYGRTLEKSNTTGKPPTKRQGTGNRKTTPKRRET